MQVNHSSVSFGAKKVSLNAHTNTSAIANGVHAEVDKYADKFDVAVKLKGFHKCDGGSGPCSSYVTKAKVVMSPKNKTPLQKALHFFHIGPRATSKSTFVHPKGINAGWTVTQAIGNLAAAAEKIAKK